MKENASIETPVSIDLKKIFKEKNPRLAASLPWFVYSYLNRALHIAEINNFLAVHGSKTGYDFTEAAIKDFNVTVTLKGEENLPEKGRYIFVSNHPLGGFDGMLLLTLLGRKYKDVRTPSNDILMNVPNIKSLFVPVNKHGSLTHESARMMDALMESDSQVLTFPAGLVSRKIRGKIIDPVWQKSFINKAVQHKRDIVPIHVSGRCTDFFYRLSNFRKFLGIKSNIEMFFLPDETYRHRNEHITITFGQPIPFSTFDKSKKPIEWAKSLQDYVYSLAEGNKNPFGF
jgi:putative hemolysin